MENITELLVKKDKDKLYLIKKLGLIIISVIIALLVFIFFNNNVAFVLLLFVGITLIAVKLSERLDVEFDYCLVEANLEIDKVYSQKTRKKYISVDQATIELVAPAESDKLKEFSSLKSIYVTNKSDAENYVVVCVAKGARCKLYIKGDDKLINQFKRFIPRKVIVRWVK